MKKIIVTAVLLSLLSLQAHALSEYDVSAECAVVITAQTGEVVFAKNSETRHSMASTTKIMTSLLAVESGRLADEITVTDSMVRVEGTSMGLAAGDSVSLEELVYGMLLPSGNDAANSTAVYLSGSVEEFVKLMNKRAGEINMKNTNFVTPSGLDDDEHYSTAYDMALLGREAVANPKFLSVCSKKKATLTYGNPPYARTLYNHNRMLSSYDCALGIKTGFTKKSGRCLVTYAEKDGVGLVAVTLNDRNDWYDHKLMLNSGFDALTVEALISEHPAVLPVVGGNVRSVKLYSDELRYSYIKRGEITQKTYLPRFVYAPLQNGMPVGRTDFYKDGVFIGSVSIHAGDSVAVKKVAVEKKEKVSFKEKLKEFFDG